MRHLLSVADLDAAAATGLLDTADRLKQALLGREVRKLPTLRGRTVITMFYENSTRTRVSFEIAGKWMSADTVNVSASGSSVAKGESLRDTALTLSAMGADCVIVRHPASGAAHRLAGWLDRNAAEHAARPHRDRQRRRRHPRAPHAGPAGRGHAARPAGRDRRPPDRHRRRRAAQPGGPVQRVPAGHPGCRGGAGGAADAAAGRGHRSGRAGSAPTWTPSCPRWTR